MLEAAADVENKLESIFRGLERTACQALRSEGFADTKQRHERSLFVRYQGQSFELEIKPRKFDVKNIIASLHQTHKVRYGYAQESNMAEIVSARLRSTGSVAGLGQKRSAGSRKSGWSIPHAFGFAYFDGKRHRVGVYRRNDLRAGIRLRVPCIVTEYSATTLVPIGANARTDTLGNIIIETNRKA
jgi:N-methylhydantoinase A